MKRVGPNNKVGTGLNRRPLSLKMNHNGVT
jgi:hypothetical protein